MKNGPLYRFARGCFWISWSLVLVGVVLGALELEIPQALADVAGSLVGMGLWLPLLYDLMRGRNEREDRALLAEEVADLLSHGFGVQESLEVLHKTRRGRLVYWLAAVRNASEEAADYLSQGSQLSEALDRTGNFPAFWRSALQTAESVESTPRLVDALRELAKLERHRPWLRFVTVVRFVFGLVLIVGTGSFLLTYVMPTFVEMMRGLEQPLPTATAWLVSTRTETGLGFILLWFLGLSIQVALAAYLFPRFGSWLWGWLSRLPFWWSVTRAEQQGRVCQALALGSGLGLSTQELIGFAQQAVGHPVYVSALEYRDGDDLSQALGRHPNLFEPELLWMMSQAEHFGNVSEAASVTATQMFRRAQGARQRASVLADTAVLTSLGLGVALLGVGLFEPLVRITELSGWVVLP